MYQTERSKPKIRIAQGKQYGSIATKLCLMWDIVTNRQVLPRDQRIHHLRASTKHLLLVLHTSIAKIMNAYKV